MLSTPVFVQSSYSDCFMALEAPVMSGWSAPTPGQKIFMPPPVPVDSTTGAEKLDLLANSSDTAWVYGKTVDEQTMRIWSRASAMAGAAMTRPGRDATASLLLITGVPPLSTEEARVGKVCGETGGARLWAYHY